MSHHTYPTAGGTVVAHDQGAHLTEWRLGDTPVIWVSAESAYAEGEPIRGGVPVCWPWFGPGRPGDLSPAHGFARIAPWRMVQEESDGSALRLTWELTHADVQGLPGAEHFTHDFTARLEVSVEQAATVALTVRNDGADSFDYEAALHTYLHVGDIRRVQIDGLDGCDYFDKVLSADATQDGPVVFAGETDRVFDSSATVQVHDPALARTLTIEKSGSASTVVWNPWTDKAAAMADFGDNEWQQMVCVEAAAVGRHAVTLPPGHEHTLSTTVRVTAVDAT